MSDFEREERYIVVKLKDIDEEVQSDLRNFLAVREIPTTQCVVVESDWPNYEKTWRDIEAVSQGQFIDDHPTAYDSYNQLYAEYESQIKRAEAAEKHSHTCELEFERALDMAEQCCNATSKEEACKILDDFKANTSFEQTAESFAELKKRIADFEGEEKASTNLICKQGDLLTTAVNKLKGEPGELFTHSHHDIADAIDKFAIEQKQSGYYDSCFESGMNGDQAKLLTDIYAERLRQHAKGGE